LRQPADGRARNTDSCRIGCGNGCRFRGGSGCRRRDLVILFRHEAIGIAEHRGHDVLADILSGGCFDHGIRRRDGESDRSAEQGTAGNAGPRRDFIPGNRAIDRRHYRDLLQRIDDVEHVAKGQPILAEIFAAVLALIRYVLVGQVADIFGTVMMENFVRDGRSVRIHRFRLRRGGDG